MRMELIQPFINAADAVLAESLHCSTRMGDLSMEEEAYRCQGIAALVAIRGDIEGRIIFDVEPATAVRVASVMAGEDLPETDVLVRETICELANQVIGNAVTTLNDQGFRFKVLPPELHTASEGVKSSAAVEALVLRFETPSGAIFMNVGMHYNRRRRGER